MSEAPDVYRRPMPPIDLIGALTIAVVVAGGIYLASHLPKPPSLVPAYALLGIAAALLAVNIALLARLKDFAWSRFFLVARWGFAAYVVIAGMLEYVFVLDHTRGAVLVILSAMLAIFAVNIPLLFGFSVARYQARPEPA
jgi:hypothetical protein